MKMDEIYGNLKLRYAAKLVIIKAGSFYRTYDNDALILWKQFGYKLNNGVASFPASSFGGVVSRLTRLGVSVVADRNDTIVNYDATVPSTYHEYLENAITSYDMTNRITTIKEKVAVKLNEDLKNYDKIHKFLEKL